MNQAPLQCLKIDIIKEPVVIPAGRNTIVSRRLDGIFGPSDKDRPKHLPPVMQKELTLIEESYHLHEFRDPSGRFQDVNFLVKKDELGLFTQLHLVQTATMRTFVAEHEAKGYKEGLQKGHEAGYSEGKGWGKKDAIDAIKALPWWKRLFNNF